MRGLPDARVSTPIRWDEVDDADPRDFTIFTVPERFAELGDLHADIDDHVFDIAPLLEWAERDERAGRRAAGRARRVTQPSDLGRRRSRTISDDDVVRDRVLGRALHRRPWTA